MKNHHRIFVHLRPRLTAIVVAISLLSACAASPPFDGNYMDRAQTQEKNGIRVTAAVPSASESKELFGTPLYPRGVQPVWLKIENTRDEFVTFLPVGLDPAYFSPIEAANLDLKKEKSVESNSVQNKRFFQAGLGGNVEPGGESNGFIFSVLDEGTKAFNVDVVSATAFTSFTFFIPVPGLRIDHHNVDWDGLYPANEIADLSRDDLIEALESAGCCVRDEKNENFVAELQLDLETGSS